VHFVVALHHNELAAKSKAQMLAIPRFMAQPLAMINGSALMQPLCAQNGKSLENQR
jgi:hypothetical protein